MMRIGILCLVGLGLSGWLAIAPSHAHAQPVQCNVFRHSTPTGHWHNTKLRFRAKHLSGFKGRFPTFSPLPTDAFPMLPKGALPLPENLTKQHQSNERRRRFLHALFADAFSMFARYRFPFPRQWGVFHNGAINIYCGGPSSSGREVCGMQTYDVGGMAQWHGGELACRGGTNSHFMTLHLNDILFTRLRAKPHDMIETVAHEVFHIVQFHSPAVGTANGLPMWWKESTARAVGNHFRWRLSKKTKTAYAKATGRRLPRPPRYNKDITRDFRRYALDYNGYTGGGCKDIAKETLIPYWTSSFWRHLARYYLPRKRYPYHFLRSILYDRSFNKPHAFDKWLSLSAKHIKRFAKRPFNFVFATFLTYLAAEKRRTDDAFLSKFSLASGFSGSKAKAWAQGLPKDGAWLMRWFGGCEKTITLDASVSGQTSALRRVVLRMLAGTCLRVRVKGVKPGTSSVSVKVMASFRKPSIAQQVHVGMAYSTSIEKYLCKRPGEKGTSHGRLPHCLLPLSPSTGRKTWSVPVHRLVFGQTSFENLYILSRAPVPVTCKEGGEDACIKMLRPSDRSPEVVTFHFSLKATKGGKQTAKKAPVKKKQTSPQSKKNARGPVLGVREYMIVEPSAAPGTFSTSANYDTTSVPLSGNIGAVNPSQPLRHLFHGNIFAKRLMSTLRKKGQVGLRGFSMRLVREKPLSNKLGEVDFSVRETYLLVLKKRLNPGTTGTFRGAIVGRSVHNPSIRYMSYSRRQGSGGDESAKVEIFAFSKGTLRARITDVLCMIDTSKVGPNSKTLCVKKIPFQLDIVQAFPLLYTANDVFRTVETATSKQFHKYELPTMVKYTSARPVASNKQPVGAGKQTGKAGTGSSSGGVDVAAAMGVKCTCQCAEKEQFASLQRKFLKLPSGTRPPAGYSRLMMCNNACQQEYSKCKTKGACDCSCAHRKKMLQLLTQVSRAGKPMPPALKAYMKCQLVCAVGYAKCFGAK